MFGVAAALVTTFAYVASAQQVTALTATLNGANEVPAVTTEATGTATLGFNPTTMVITWTVTYLGLSGPATAGNIHGPAAATANAGSIISLGLNLASPIAGTATLTPEQAGQLLAGMLYINIRTNGRPGGEIRGQITTP